MLQNRSFSPKSGAYSNDQQTELLISPDLLWRIIQDNFSQIAWRKAFYSTPPSLSEIEQQKKAFVQKFVEMVRKSSASKPNLFQHTIQNQQESAKMLVNSSTDQKV